MATEEGVNAEERSRGFAPDMGAHEDQRGPEAKFICENTSGPAPLEVRFEDRSTEDTILRSWDFGDGDTSTEQHPIHTYDTPGTYTVKLVVTGPGACFVGCPALLWPSFAAELMGGRFFQRRCALLERDISERRREIIEKRVLCADRVRTPNGSFAFPEHRFFRDGFWETLGHHALMLYVFLILVGDRKGPDCF